MNYSLQDTTSNLSTGHCSLLVAHGVSLITANVIVVVFGTIGNLLVCVAVLTNPRLRRPSNFLLFSLAIADLIVTMVCEPLFVVTLLRITLFNDCARTLDKLYVILAELSSSASIAHMAAISVDRFIAVVYPLHHRRVMDRCGLKGMLITSWIFPITIPILKAVIPATIPIGFFGLAIFGVSYVTVFLSYFLIVITLLRYRSKRNHLRAHSSSSGLSQGRLRVEVRVAFTLGIIIIVYTACWFPLVATVFATGKLLVKKQGVAFMWIRTLALSNSAMNFLIYGSRMQSFREAFALIGQKICGHLLALKPSRTRVYNLT